MSLTEVLEFTSNRNLSFATHSPTYVEQEARLNALESQLQDLLAWKQTILSAFLGPKVEKVKLTTPTPSTFSKLVETTLPNVVKATSVDKLTPSTRVTALPIRAAPSLEISAPVESKPVEQVAVLIETPITTERPSTQQAFRVLNVLQRYGQHIQDENDKSAHRMWLGRAKFLPKIEQHVEACQPIKMILPSFPWKSVNSVDKVTGKLPDLGEELALARLNALCKDIGEIYEHGAEVTIATDGLVFNGM